jgi:glucan endo-1,3-alpha-glucosidase
MRNRMTACVVVAAVVALGACSDPASDAVGQGDASPDAGAPPADASAGDGAADAAQPDTGQPPATGRRVFAHYMVAIRSYGGSVEGYVRDIEDARAGGVDGFALNLAGFSVSNYRKDLESIFTAVEQVEPGFVLFLSPDMCCGLPREDIIEMISLYFDHPAYFRHEGRPVLSGYGIDWQESAQAHWKGILDEVRAGGHDLFFVPHAWMPGFAHQPSEEEIRDQYTSFWGKLFDGFFYFGAAMLPEYTPSDSLLTMSERYARVTHDNGGLYMAPVSPQYWGAKQESIGRRYYEYQGGEGLERQWRSIIEQQKAEWVELVTWNDFDEASYFSPIEDVNEHWPYLDRPELGFYNPHGGLLELNRYFADWYRSGSTEPPPAPGGADHLFHVYRVHPEGAVAPDDPRGPVTWRYGDVQDVLYVTTLTVAPAELKVTTGGHTETRSVPAGLHHVRIPFQIGAQGFELWRDGALLVKSDGRPIVGNPSFYNFHYTTGHASSGP